MAAHYLTMKPARHALFAFIASCASAPSVTACCLTDWLYGRAPAYAVVAPAPVTVGYAPTGACDVTPYAAGYTPYTAGYTPLLTPAANSMVLPLAGTSIYSPPAPYAVQRPAYGAVPLDNPSVYTGLPVTSGYRGVATTGNSFYGTGNMYPNNYASASSGAFGGSAYQANYGSSVPLAVAPTYPTPVRSGLARFFDSLLGTGYRTSYYTAPITYYRPATSFDPVTGTTVTVQQPCTSTVQQLQRSPYATLQPAPMLGQTQTGGASCGVDPYTGIDPCSATSPYGPSTGSVYGASPIPSTSLDSGFGSPNGNGMGSGLGMTSGDLKPMSQPTLPSAQPSISGRFTYPNASVSADTPTYSEPSWSSPSTDSFPSTNLSPLTGDSPSYRREVQPDQEPMPAPSIEAARPNYSLSDEREAADEAWQQGYEAGRAATREESKSASEPAYTPYEQPRSLYDDADNDEESDTQIEPDRPSTDSYYQLNPPENGRSSDSSPESVDEARRRTRWEVERDQRDVRELTTGVPSLDSGKRYVTETATVAPRVRPIPAPQNYRNPFERSTERLQAPDLLPALPRPNTPYDNGVQRASGYSNEPQRLSVPVREASIQGQRDRIPSSSSQQSLRPSLTEPVLSPPPKANAWQTNVREQSQESGWYPKSR